MRYYSIILFLCLISTPPLTAQEADHDPNCTSCQGETASSHSHDKTDTHVPNRLSILPTLVIDTFGYYQDSGPSAFHLTELAGFGHGPEEDGHDHNETENGLNLRHIELSLYATFDARIDGRATVAFEEEDTEVEEAFIRARGVMEDIDLTAGKVFSSFGLQNASHSHAWHFWNRPLIYEAIFGEHGLNGIGVTFDWAPQGEVFSAGIEALQGGNNLSFAKIEADALPEKNGPRLWTGWAAADLGLGEKQRLRFKLSAASGYHQEAHDEDGDDTPDHWLHGRSTLFGAGIHYNYFGNDKHGSGMVSFRGEYIYRRKFLKLKEHLLSPGEIGNNFESEQDGYYLELLYGVRPKWRLGLRWEEAGMKNVNHLPDGTSESFGPNRRLSGIVSRQIGHGSLVRFQVGHGDYELEDAHEKNWEFIVQWQVTFGGHKH